MNFFSKYFIDPIINNTYTTLNTFVYVGLLLLFCFGLLYPWLKKRELINFKLFTAILPYVIVGALLRIAEEPYSAVHLIDKATSPLSLGFWFITPGIYIVMFVGTFLILIICWKLNKEKALNYFRNIGLFFCLALLIPYLLLLTKPIHFALTLLAIIVVSGIFFILLYYFKPEYLKEKLNLTLLFSQIFDGFATYFAIAFFGFGEKHVLSNWVIINIGVIAFPILKIILSFVIIILIEKSITVKNKNILNFTRILISIIGFATGIRDLFSIGLNL